jgi:predicted RNase H-like nuclease
MLPPKRSAEGKVLRLRLLEAQGLRNLDRLIAHRPSGVAVDDLIDAAVCALVARDLAYESGQRVPESEPSRDSRGLRMEIWY